MKPLLALCLLVVWAGCSDEGTNPDDGVRERDLTFLRFEDANAVTVRSASFWAVRGQDRRLEMSYASGEEFLRLEVDDNSLLRRPDGTLFVTGDSVLITVHLDDMNRFIVYFEPSGLTFNPLDPAELRINYNYADPDLDRDGDEDAHDLELEANLRIWQQEQLGLPWLPLATLRIDEDDLRANVLSFTGFAMASN
jgi:hypothetical protein